MLVSSCCFLSAMESLPALRNLGEVMWPSPPLSFAVSFISRDVRRQRNRLHPYIFADSIPMEGPSVQGGSRQ